MSLSHALVLCPLLALTAASRSASAGALGLSLHPHALPGKALIMPGNVCSGQQQSGTPSLTLGLDVLEAASSVLSVFSPTQRVASARKDMKAGGCAEAGKHAAIKDRQY